LNVQNVGLCLNQSKRKPQLKLDWCSHEAAKYAVEHWHYSKSMPAGKTTKVGVWEDGKFIGCIIFGWGTIKHLVGPYGLSMTEGCELTRVALNAHVTPVSRILSIAIKMLKKQSPGLRLIVSYADSDQNHHGGIYQATNWIYDGHTGQREMYIYRGQRIHPRSASSKFGGSIVGVPGLRKIRTGVKHRYLYPLDAEMKQRISKLSKPYPKKPRDVSIEGDATSDPAGGGSFNATTSLPEHIGESSHAH